MKRVFIPGEEWLSLKLYMGELFANDFLVYELSPLIERLKGENLIEKWYYIRYQDPKFHLRIRLKLIDVNDYGKLINILKDTLREYVDNELIRDIQYCNYSREIERYGAENIEIVETIFEINSELALILLENIEKKKYNEYVWKFTLKYINFILVECGYTDKMKFVFINELKESFEAEFSVNKKQEHQIKQKYRIHRSDIEFFTSNSNINNFSFEELNDPIINHFKRLKQLLSEFIIKLKIEKNIPISGLIHMHFNRLFDNEPRRYELMIYSFLTIYYNSELKKRAYDKINQDKRKKSNYNPEK